MLLTCVELYGSQNTFKMLKLSYEALYKPEEEIFTDEETEVQREEICSRLPVSKQEVFTNSTQRQ